MPNNSESQTKHNIRLSKKDSRVKLRMPNGFAIEVQWVHENEIVDICIVNQSKPPTPNIFVTDCAGQHHQMNIIGLKGKP